MGDELKWLLEERGGHIFLRGVIDGGYVGVFSRVVMFLVKICPSHVVSRALFM